MGRIEQLVESYQNHIATSPPSGLAGAEKAIFVVYDKANERRIRARKEHFQIATQSAGYKWKEIDLAGEFAHWMTRLDYANEYFSDPDSLELKLADFEEHLGNLVGAVLQAEDSDEDTIVAMFGVASLFGFTRVSRLMKQVEPKIRGRLVVFFPGEHEDNVYRLLDARDGWNYLAVPITAENGAY